MFEGGSTNLLFLKAFEKSLQKGELYSAFIGLLYAAFGQKPKIIFLFQALLDTLSCLFIYLIANRLGGISVGLIALGIASVYEPSIFSTARIQTESFASFIFLGGICSIFISRPTWQLAGNFLGGLLIALSMLTKTLFKYIFFMLVPIIAFLSWNYPFRRRSLLALAFIAGFFILIGPRLLLTNNLTRHPLLGGWLDPSIEMYAGAVIENIGWKTGRLSFALPPRNELLVVLGNDPAKTPSMADYRKATLRTWLFHPIQSAGVMLHKLYEAWAHAYNDSHFEFLSGLAGQDYFHQLILILGIIGMPISMRYRGNGIALILVTLYLWLMYLSVKIEVRNSFPVMPLMICFAALAVWKLVDGLRSVWKSAHRNRIMFLILALILVIVSMQIMSLARILEIFPTLSAHIVRGFQVCTTILIITLIACIVIEIFSHSHGWKRALAGIVLPLALAILVLTVGRSKAYTWYQWESPLYANQGKIRQEFLLPSNLPLPYKAELKLDLLPSLTTGYDLVIKANGIEVKHYPGGLKRSDANLPEERSYTRLFEIRNEQTKPAHAWYTVPITLKNIVPGERLQFDVKVEGDKVNSGSVIVFGDYTLKYSIYEGSSLFSPSVFGDTSIYKYLTQGDFRMLRRIQLNGSANSSFHNDSEWSSSDLSSEPGRQYGRYRIFLVLSYENKQMVF